MLKYFLIITVFLSSISVAKNNISLSKTLLRFQGEEYNTLLFPHHVVVNGKKRKTKIAISKGYKRAIRELERQVARKGVSLNIKGFNKNGSNLPQYIEQDAESYALLKEMIRMQVEIRESIFEDVLDIPEEKTKVNVSADDIDLDLDDAFDISNDKGKTENDKLLSPAEAFSSGYVELSENYNAQVLELHKVKHPFNINGKPMMKKVHSVFGLSFFPTKNGRIKMMKLYVILVNINSESAKSVQIIAKDVPNFQWDRNYLYISAVTGKVIRQIVSGVLGEPFLIIKR